MIFQLVVSCVDFNYKSADKTDQTSIEDKTGYLSYTESQAIQSENKGEVGVAAGNRLVVILRYRERERERREIVNSNLRPSQVVITYRVDSQH